MKLFYFYFIFQQCSSPYLANDLNSVWPNLLGPNDIFWRNEWETHGTCAYELFPDQAEYFHKALILKYNNDVLSWLASNRIRPYMYRDYYVKSIKTAISRNFGAKPRLRCTTAYGIPRQLVEVRLCFNEEGTMPQDCLRPDINCGSRKIKWYT
jgi:ribonuclease I